MEEHIKNVLTESLLDDERFCEAFCNGCGAIKHYSGDLDNPPEDRCPCEFSIGDDRDCAKFDDWERIETALEIAAAVAAGSTNKEAVA